jgi:hypothetical protein
MKVWTRRDVLRLGAAGAGACVWPWGWAVAQGGAAGLLRAPKRALVIGNSKYRHAPLKNPVNDANGMAAALKEVGFEVALGIDLSQAAMREAMQAFGEGLSKSGAVGLFYFAGHGAQLAWRNYLIPVDAEIADVQELRERAVDLNGLIENIRQAGNPMNVLILDACRDNPFGSAARLEQRGLSQLDAPPGTLLAYATAPGNTAIDGDGGEHGLYTEHLLKEIRVPEAKVEDVFKRVRLGVRRRSKGLQIPWESTSLEQDFWFIPPATVRKLAEAEVEREFRQELALWEKIQNAAQPEPFEDYLRRYPNGRFTELAQLRLDRELAKLGEKRVEIVSAPDNPYTKGTVRTDTVYRIGDTYAYRVVDIFTKLEIETYTHTVAEITDNEIKYTNGAITDLLGNPLRGVRLVRTSSQYVPSDFTVGRRWSTRFISTVIATNFSSEVELNFRVADRERITVPAGTFDAFRIEGWGWAKTPKGPQQWTVKRWYAPQQVRHYVAGEFQIMGGANRIIVSRWTELTSFKQG